MVSRNEVVVVKLLRAMEKQWSQLHLEVEGRCDGKLLAQYLERSF